MKLWYAVAMTAGEAIAKVRSGRIDLDGERFRWDAEEEEDGFAQVRTVFG